MKYLQLEISRKVYATITVAVSDNYSHGRIYHQHAAHQISNALATSGKPVTWESDELHSGIEVEQYKVLPVDSDSSGKLPECLCEIGPDDPQ